MIKNVIKKTLIILKKIIKNTDKKILIILKNIIKNIMIKIHKKPYSKLKQKQKVTQINIITLQIKKYLASYIQSIILNQISIMQGKQLQDSIIDILKVGYMNIVKKILLNMIWNCMDKNPLNTLRYSKWLIHNMNQINQKHIILITTIRMKMVIMKIEVTFLQIEGSKNN